MKITRVTALFCLALLLSACAQTSNSEWKKLDAEALTLHHKGQYAQAEPLYKRALVIKENTFGPDHPDVATTLYNLAALHKAQGVYTQVEPLLKRALAIFEKTLSPNHDRMASSLNTLAGLYQAQGQYAQAEPLYQRTLTVREKALGPDHPDVALHLNDLAVLYLAQGLYTQVEPLLKRALAILEKALGPDHPDAAFTLNNLAVLYQAQGLYTQAEPLLKRALAIREKALGPDHPDVAVSLNNLAELYKAQGQYTEVEPLYQRALAIQEKTFGPGHPDVALSLNNLAALYQAQGLYTQAEPLYQRALAIREKALGPDHPDVALGLSNLAALYQAQGLYTQVEPLLKRALEVWEKALGLDHPNVALGLSNLAISAWSQRDTGRAVELMRRANAVHEHNLGLFLLRGSEHEKRAYMAIVDSDTHAITSLHLAAETYKPDAAYLALTTLLQRKGRVLDALADSFADLRRRLDPEDAALLDQLSSVNGKRAALYMLVRQAKIKPEQYHSQIAKLEEEARAFEAKISATSAEFRALAQPITLKGVQQAIPEGVALVEFLVYRPFNPVAKTREDSWGPARYVAYVLRSEGEPVSVDLGEANAIERVVVDLRQGLSDPNNVFVNRVARKLDEQVMRPVRKLLGDTRTVLLSPDGALNLVPFGALVDENNQYLIKYYTFTYLSSGRDLLRISAKSESRQVLSLPTWILDTQGNRFKPNRSL